MKVNIHQAKTQFSRLIARVSEGEEVIIAKAGRPVARLIAIKQRAAKRKLGQGRGKLKVPKDFDAPLPEEVLRSFEGE